MAFEVTVKIGGKLKRFQETVEAKPHIMARMFAQWIRIFTAFLRKRFVSASRGDGTWPALRPSTVARRRKNSDVILRDTGLLFSQLSPSFADISPIQKTGRIFKAAVTFGGHAKYPDTGATVTDIMGFHQKGGPRLPQRKIIVDPDAKTMEQMTRSAKKIITTEINGK